MVIGTAGPLPTAPSKPITFLEDMADDELALAVSTFLHSESRHDLLGPTFHEPGRSQF